MRLFNGLKGGGGYCLSTLVPARAGSEESFIITAACVPAGLMMGLCLEGQGHFPAPRGPHQKKKRLIGHQSENKC